MDPVVLAVEVASMTATRTEARPCLVVLVSTLWLRLPMASADPVAPEAVVMPEVEMKHFLVVAA
ncbi:hypothetical protein A2U01_0093309, partial [Trifolium medium]|nr:hypothetical protein [Trifolium medium]